MANCLQLPLSNANPGKEDEYNAWYSDHHVYRVVLTPGVLAGQRFRRTDAPWPAGRHDYLAIWELDDPPYVLDQLEQRKWTDAMPIPDCVDMVTIQPPTLWVRASARNRARIAADSTTRGTVVFMLANAAGGDDEAFERALLEGGLAALADRPGVLSVDLLTLADEQIRNNARKFRFGLLIELADEARGIGSLRDVLPALPHLDAERWQAPVFRSMGRRVTKAEAEAHGAA